ncbi:hypothetical protein ACP275_14G023400 [Erythranthe tilingii]
MAANDNANDTFWKDYESMRADFYDLSNIAIVDEVFSKIRFQDFAYCNYNPKALYDTIAKRISDNKWNTTKACGEITKAVIVGLVRGNITQHQIWQMAGGGGGGGEIVRLAADFGIRIRKNSKEKLTCEQDTLTFVRFLSLFPEVASRLCLIIPSNLTQKIPCDGIYSACILPVGMKHSGFAALIPAGPDYRAVRGYLSVAFTAFMVEFWDVMNPKKSNRAPQVKFDEQFRLTETAIDDGRMSDERRITALKVAMVNSRVSLDRILRVVGNVRRVHGMAVEDPGLYKNDAVLEGDFWKLGHTREIEDETGIEGIKKKYPDYGEVMDHASCSSVSSSSVDAATSATADLPFSSEAVVFPGLTGFPI